MNNYKKVKGRKVNIHFESTILCLFVPLSCDPQSIYWRIMLGEHVPLDLPESTPVTIRTGTSISMFSAVYSK